MCGIAGILRVYPPGVTPPPHFESIPEAWLDLLDDSIKHRGPDGQGRFRDRAMRANGSIVDVALIHRRLSILDHKGGAQPMVSSLGSPSGLSPSARTEGVASDRRPQDRAGGGALPPDSSFPLLFQGSPTAEARYESIAGITDDLLAVTFNGCIYNHRALRKELEAKGHHFVTDHSDTEVLLHGWREWRFDLLDRLEGMYAVALWDRTKADAVLLRDRFGEKPLECAFTVDKSRTQTHVWASSYTGLIDFLGAIQPDDLRVTRPIQVGWIRYGWNFTTPILSTASVPPGAGFFVQLQSQAPMRHAVSLYRGSQNPLPSVDNADTILRRAVHNRLDSDVPLGVFLSGGIDSGLIAKYAAEKRHDLRAFTVRMPQPDFDESEAAALTARSLGIRHEILDCHTDAASDLVDGIEQLGLPFGDSSLLPTIWLCRAAKPHVSVALCGDGGDELFLGYERQNAARALGLAGMLDATGLSTIADLIDDGSSPKSRRSKLARFCRAAAGDGYGDLVAIFPSPMAESLLGEGSQSYYTPWALTSCLERVGTDRARTFDTYAYLPFDLLRKSDTASMSVALELRSPMLDSTVARLAINASRQSLMPRGQRKGLLRAVARKYLPKEIVDRPKMGFAIPVGEWFRSDFGQMRTLLLDMLHSADPFPADLLGLELNRRFVDRMLAEHMESRRDHSQRLYMLLVLAIWCCWLKRVKAGPHSPTIC